MTMDSHLSVSVASMALDVLKELVLVRHELHKFKGLRQTMNPFFAKDPVLKRMSSGGDPVSIFIENFSSLISSLMLSNHSSRVFRSLHVFLCYLASEFQQLGLANSNQLLNTVCMQSLRHSMSADVEVRTYAGLSLMAFAKAEYHCTKEFDKTMGSITLAIFHLLNELEGEGPSKRLQQFIAQLRAICSIDRTSESFKFDFLAVLARVESIYTATLEIARQKALKGSSDVMVYEDLCHNMALNYEHLPDVKRDWLDNLTQSHLEFNKFAEAALCQMEVARLLEISLEEEKKAPVDLSKKKIHKIEDSLIVALENAVKYYQDADLWESSCDVLKFRLLPLYEKMPRSYVKLSDAYGALSKLYRKLGEYVLEVYLSIVHAFRVHLKQTLESLQAFIESRSLDRNLKLMMVKHLCTKCPRSQLCEK